jgi:hypothetical protein
LLRGLRNLEQVRLRSERAVAADAVERTVARRHDQPRTRVVRRAVARPALGGDHERLLRSLLGKVEITEEADQGGDYPPPLLPEDLLD